MVKGKNMINDYHISLEHLSREAENWVRSVIGIQDTKDVIIMPCMADNMMPSIQRLDLVFIDVMHRHIDSPGIYLFDVGNNNYLLKRVMIQADGTLIIRSDNTDDFPDEERYGSLSGEPRINVCGKYIARLTPETERRDIGGLCEQVKHLEKTYEETYERLSALSAATPKWLSVDREILQDRIIADILATYRKIPAPQKFKGIKTGLDFLGLLLTEGSDNGLYELTMEQLESEIYHAVSKLPDDEIIALLLPMEEGDMGDLFTDREIIEWPHFLLQGTSWQEKMRKLLLSQVKPKDRY